jgi:hypothetical protein
MIHHHTPGRARTTLLLVLVTTQTWALPESPQKPTRLTDDQVARWVLSANAGPNFVTFSEAGKVTQVVDPAKLPAGKYEVVSLSFTSLDQVTPEHLSHVSRLSRLVFLEFKDASALTAAGVKTLCNSLTLSALIIAKSGLTDEDLAPLSKLKSLGTLSLQECPKLTGAVWQAWRGWGLTSFTLGGWQVARENLPKLAGLKSLQTLKFTGANGLTAEDFAGWSHPSVWQLWLISMPSLTGKLRPVLGAFPKVLQVYVHGTPLNAQDCVALAQFRPLQYLQLASASIGDLELPLLAASKSMGSLDCFGFISGGTSLDQLAGCRPLRALGFFDSQLTDAGVARLAALGQIEQLVLCGNTGLTDAAFAPIAAMKQLRVLRLVKTAITNPTLARFIELRKLETLELTGCPNLTPDGIALIRKALPKCNVAFQP